MQTSNFFSAQGVGRVFFCLLFLITFASCKGEERLPARDLVIETQNGTVSVRAEIARTQAEHSRGLMFRRKLADGHGMFFYNESDRILTFWMKNTFIPLSIAFISSEGKILEIYDMEVEDLSSVSSSRSVRYALEVSRGWFNRAGIKVGDRVRVEDL